MLFDPSKEELQEKISSGLPLTKIGQYYGVSVNAIRKRCKKLQISFKR
jgi:hypothetical protein